MKCVVVTKIKLCRNILNQLGINFCFTKIGLNLIKGIAVMMAEKIENRISAVVKFNINALVNSSLKFGPLKSSPNPIAHSIAFPASVKMGT